MSINKNNLAIIIPVFNEEDIIEKVINDWLFIAKKFDGFIIVINDGSSDNTYSVLEDLRIKFPKHINVINQEKNEGKAAAVRLGINSALKNNKFDRFAFLDADLSTSIEECLLLSEKVTKEIIEFRYKHLW